MLFSATLIIGVITFSNTMEQITFQIIEFNLHGFFAMSSSPYLHEKCLRKQTHYSLS